MKKIILAVICVAIATSLSASSTGAATNPNFKLQIFPLECSFDTVDLGHVTSLGLTPEDCFPEPPTPPGPAPSPSTPQQQSGGFAQQFYRSGTRIPAHIQFNPNLTPNLAQPDIQSSPVVNDSRQINERSTNQGHSAIIVGSIALLIAGILAASHAVMTGIGAPIINFFHDRVKWPKFKK